MTGKGWIAAMAVMGWASLAAAEPAVIVHGPAGPAAEIIFAEHMWSDRFATIGEAKGFREFLDPADGLSFGAGDPVHADAFKAAAEANKPPTEVLSWAPAEVFASQAGDMGASWGHYKTTPVDPKKKVETGRYVTVWRKDAAGHWKAIMDIGNPDPAPAAP